MPIGRLAVRASLGPAARERADPQPRRPPPMSPAGLQLRLGNHGAQVALQALVDRPVPAPVKPGPAASAAVPEAPAPQAEALAPARAPPPPAETKAEPPAKAEQSKAETPAAAPAAEPEKEAPPVSPKQAVAPVAAAVRKRAARARDHALPEAVARNAHDAANLPSIHQAQQAAVLTVGRIRECDPKPVDRDNFRARMREAILNATPPPKSESDGEKLRREGGKQASAVLKGELVTRAEKATDGLGAAAHQNAQIKPADVKSAPPEVALAREQAGTPPPPVASASAVPPPLPAGRPDFSGDRGETDQAMAEAEVTPEQLDRSNEPDFAGASEAQRDAVEREKEREVEFRDREAGILGGQGAATKGMLGQGLKALHATRTEQLGGVAKEQTNTSTTQARERLRIEGVIQGIKNDTRTQVLTALDAMVSEATAAFDEGLKAAEDAYQEAFDEEKGGVGNWLTKWGDDWEDLINSALAKGRDAYNKAVSDAINSAAFIVQVKLDYARRKVREGKDKIDRFVEGLGASVATFGLEAKAAIEGDFQDMESLIDERRDAMLDSLVEKYSQSQKRVTALENKLREANKSLWRKIRDATIGVIKKILAFKDFLLTILAKVAGVVSAIISDPIGFFRNLLLGVRDGFSRFQDRGAAHVRNGLETWLFGELEGGGLKLPETWDVRGVIDVVGQVSGLNKTNIRRRAVGLLGEPAVAALEAGWEVLDTLYNEGPGALWQQIVAQAGDLKEMLFSELIDWITGKIIIAGIKWLLALFSPVSAFIKACLAIYDLVKFFIDRATQIAELISAMLDSLGLVVRGNVAAMGTAIEGTLAKAVPLGIGLFASLLNLGGIPARVRGAIDKLQKPVNNAIDAILRKGSALVAKAGGFVKDKAQAIASRLGFRRKMTFASGASHVLSVAGTEQRPVVMMASTADPVEVHLQKATIDPGLSANAQKEAAAALAHFQAKIVPLLGQPLPAQNKAKPLAVGDLPRELDAFSNMLVKVSEAALGKGAIPPVSWKTKFTGRRHSSIEMLSNKDSTKGVDASASSGTPPGWDLLQIKGLTKSEWVRMHMISAGFGGNDEIGNLVPAPKSVNSGGPVRNFETAVEEILYARKGVKEVRKDPSAFAADLAKLPSVIWVKCETKGDHPEERDPLTNTVILRGGCFVTDVTLTAGLHYLDVKSGKWEKDDKVVAKGVDIVPKPNLTGAAQSWWTLGKTALSAAAGFSIYFAGVLIDWAKSTGKTGKADLDNAHKAGQLTPHSDEAIDKLDQAVAAKRTTY